MESYRKTSTYDLTTELMAERAYYQSLLRTGADSEAIAACVQRIRAITAELEHRPPVPSRSEPAEVGAWLLAVRNPPSQPE